MNQPTDKELVYNILSKKNEHRSFEMLISRYQKQLYYSIRRMVNRHEDADDVLQNTFIKVWKNLGSFEGKSSIYTWMYRIAYNETLNYIQKNKKHMHLHIDEPVIQNTMISPSDNPYNGEDIKRKLNAAIEQLPEKQRMVFNMKYFEEKKYEEISEITGTSTGALKASYFHAVKKIEESLKND